MKQILWAVFSGALLFYMPDAGASGGGMNGTMLAARNEFRRQLGCEWKGGTSDNPECRPEHHEVILELFSNPADGSVESFEIRTFIMTCPRRAKVEARNRTVVKKAVGYMLPEWKGAGQWLDQAFRKAERPKGRSVTKVGNVTVLVQRMQAVDLCETMATTVLTKKSSLEQWDEPW
jgi:hypothetical protein